jgi:ubiquitin-conjugating enzyme E2 J1
MLSKAMPIEEPSPSQASEEPKNEEAETHVTLQNPEALPAGEGIPDQAGDRIVEEQEVPVNVNANPAGVEASNEIPSGVSTNQLPRTSDTRVQNLKPEIKVQKPDDRLFTLAAIGLAIAIMVLLLKKFIKSTDHGAVFMDGS